MSPRLREPGMPHEHAPDKAPGARLASLRFAAEARFPFTTGLLVGIGETIRERMDTRGSSGNYAGAHTKDAANGTAQNIAKGTWTGVAESRAARTG